MTATRKPPYALLAAALVAFNPQFLFEALKLPYNTPPVSTYVPNA